MSAGVICSAARAAFVVLALPAPLVLVPSVSRASTPPATDPRTQAGWILDASASVPRLESETYSLDGFGKLGFSGSSLGGWVAGRAGVLDVVQDEPYSESTESSRSVDAQGWWAPPSVPGASIGVTAGFLQLSSDSLATLPRVVVVEESNQRVRVGAVAAVEAGLGGALLGRAEVRGGVVRDAHLQQVAVAGESFSDATDDRTYLWGALGVGCSWSAWPNWATLALRTEVEVSRQTLSTAALEVRAGEPATIDDRASSVARLESFVFASVHVDAVEIAGVHPFGVVGLRLVRLSSGDSAAVVGAPAAGVGIATTFF